MSSAGDDLFSAEDHTTTNTWQPNVSPKHPGSVCSVESGELPGPRRAHAVDETYDCVAVSVQANMCPMKPRALYWWHMIMLAAASLLLSAIITGCLAYIADHILWE
jgi:hypothetical protein